MSQRSWQPNDKEADEGQVRFGWLKAMYVANVALSLPLGTSVLIAPELMRGLLGVPAGDPVNYVIATGAIPLAFGLAGVAGLRAPLRFSPVLGLQLVYKTLFLIGGVLPMALTGPMPGYVTPVIVIFVFFAIGNGIAVPFRYLLSEPSA